MNARVSCFQCTLFDFRRLGTFPPFLFVVALLAVVLTTIRAVADDAIQPGNDDARYWQYQGRLVLLLGASGDDNLFQHRDLKRHLDEMKSVGANYVRNTMSDRDEGNVYPYARRAGGDYDLEDWNDEYWQRFDNFLRLTCERGIIVQIEIWDRFDLTDSKDLFNWRRHPYNPKNNVNYSYDDTGFAREYLDHPGRNKQPFYKTVPALDNNQVVLRYQQRFVDKMLSYSLRYPHVLYCMDNETSGDEAWGAYWADYVQHRAQREGKTVYTTEMWDDWNIRAPRHRRTFDHPERYAFVDISQNNHNRGDEHWENLMWARQYLGKVPRPINTVKIYGADTGRYGNDQDGVERFWRNLLAGCAATRFHRPTSGLGLSEKAKTSVRVARAVESHVRFWMLAPANELLTDRGDNEAFLAAKPGHAYVVYFPRGGGIGIRAEDGKARYALRWYRVADGIESPQEEVTLPAALATPDDAGSVAVLTRIEAQEQRP